MYEGFGAATPCKVGISKTKNETEGNIKMYAVLLKMKTKNSKCKLLRNLVLKIFTFYFLFGFHYVYFGSIQFKSRSGYQLFSCDVLWLSSVFQA